MCQAPERPDEVALMGDIQSLDFKLAVRRGKWKVVGLAFPYLYVTVTAPKRTQGPNRFLLRIDFTGYRATAPTAALWNGADNTALSDALKPLNAHSGVVIGFSSALGQCLYHPIDRQARAHWPNAHADLAWGPDSTIMTFLETVHALLHDTNYVRSAATDALADLQKGALESDPVRAA